MQELEKLINNFLDDDKPVYNSAHYIYNRNHNRNIERDTITEDYTSKYLRLMKPLTYDEAFVDNIDVHSKISHGFDYIDESLYNKKIKINENTELLIYHTFSTKNDLEYHYAYELENNNRARTTRCDTDKLKVVLVYHGVCFLLGHSEINKYIDIIQYKQGYKEYNLDTSDVSKNYHIKQVVKDNYPHYYVNLPIIFKKIDINSAEDISEIDINYVNNIDTRNVHKNIATTIDMEYFVKIDSKDGIYKPEKHTVDKFLQHFYTFDTKWKHGDLLHKLGIHTVILRGNAHYDITCFKLKNIKVKAPKNIIERYDLVKYCIDDKVAKEIVDKQKKEEEEMKLLEHNNKFTLMRDGKVILDYKDKEDIIEYLEDYLPSGKTFEDEIIDHLKPIFKKFKDIERFYIGYWGTYYKYELRGSTCDFRYFDEYRDISVETANAIDSFTDDAYPNVDVTILHKKYGEEYIQCIGVERIGKKLEIFVENYDVE